MATIQPLEITNHGFDGPIKLIKWSPVTENDTCAPTSQLAMHSDKTVIVTGTFGGASFGVSGANDPTLTAGSFVPLKDQSDNVIAITAAGAETIVNAVYAIVPLRTGGSSTSVSIWMYARDK